MSESHSVVSDSLQPHGLYSPWNSPGQNTGVGSRYLLQGISRYLLQGIEPRSPGLQVDSLLSEPLGKPKNTGVQADSLPAELTVPILDYYSLFIFQTLLFPRWQHKNPMQFM